MENNNEGDGMTWKKIIKERPWKQKKERFGMEDSKSPYLSWAELDGEVVDVVRGRNDEVIVTVRFGNYDKIFIGKADTMGYELEDD